MLLEFVFLGRGGQGIYTATELLTKAALIDGYYAQGVPFFGAERRGAVTYSFLRISDKKILRHDAVRIADGVMVGDASQEVLSLLKTYKVKNRGKLIVNINRTSSLELSKLTGAQNRPDIYGVEADAIAKAEGLVVSGWPIIGPVLAGALSRVFGVPTISSVQAAMRHMLGNQEDILAKNLRLVMSGYNTVRLLRYELQQL